MSVSVSGYITPTLDNGTAPYSQFFVDSSEYMKFQLKTLNSAGTAAALDISASNLSVQFRASLNAGGAFLTDSPVTLDKVVGTASAGDTGIVDGRMTFRAAQTADVECCLVLIDANVTDAATYSGKRETVWGGKWVATVSVQVGP